MGLPDLQLRLSFRINLVLPVHLPIKIIKFNKNKLKLLVCTNFLVTSSAIAGGSFGCSSLSGAMSIGCDSFSLSLSSTR